MTVFFPQHYGQRVQEELIKAQQECDAQERQLQQWHDHWQSQLKTLNASEIFMNTDSLSRGIKHPQREGTLHFK